MTPEITVGLVDDDPVVRVGLTAILSRHPDLSVVGDGEDGDAALRLCAQQRPDVLLLDLRMPRRDGLSALEELSRRGLLGSGRTRVLILTTFDTDDLVDRALEAGASGFVLKNSSHEEIAAAIRAAAAGHTVLSPSLTGRIVRNHLSEHRSPSAEDLSRAASLTPREREVLDLIGSGLSNQEIGTELFLSLHTVKTHVSRVLTKTSSSSRARAALLAQSLRRHRSL